MARPIMGVPMVIPNNKVEEEFRKSAPEVLYKYRNWTSKFSKDALKQSEIWFSSPKQLNDVKDIRLVYDFDSSEVEKAEFLEKLRKEFPRMTNLIPGSLAFVAAFLDHYEAIRKDPQTWFYTNQQNLRESEIYEQVGLFSTTELPLQKLMWAHYADSHYGYCIGYDPYFIFRTKQSHCGIAHYSEERLTYSFLDPDRYNFIDLFMKDAVWEYEREYRFVTYFEKNENRLVKLPLEATKEVIIGLKMSTKESSEIVACLKDIYLSKVRLFKVEENLKGELSLKQMFY